MIRRYDNGAVIPTAKWTLTENLTEPSLLTFDTPELLGMHEFVRESEHGEVFRVVSVSKSGNLYSVSCRHAIDCLSDAIYPEQTDYSGSIAEILAKIESYNGAWQLGVCECEDDYNRSGINYTSLSDLWQEIADLHNGFRFTYDFSTVPWTFNYVRMATEPVCGFRLSRGISTAQISQDDSEMCNRLYLSVNTKTGTKTETEIRTYNDAESQAVYGVIAKTADIDTEDVADPDQWADEFLAERKRPVTQISLTGADMYRLTGQRYDLHRIGDLASVSIDGYAETERIISVEYRDDGTTVFEMSTKPIKASSAIARINAEARRAGGAARAVGRSAASAEEVTQWAMVVQHHTEALDGTGITELHETGIVLDADTGATIYSLNQGFQSQYSAIQTNAREISLRVQAGDIASEINQTAQAVRISASKINLDGYVTATELSATDARITNLSNGTASATLLRSGVLRSTISFYADGVFYYKGEAFTKRSLEVRKADGGTQTIYYLGRTS